MSGVHTIFGRLERVVKDELFVPGEPLYGQRFAISKLSLGYVYDFAQAGAVRFSAGGVVSQHWSPASLDSIYGRNPFGWSVLVRAKLAAD